MEDRGGTQLLERDEEQAQAQAEGGGVPPTTRVRTAAGGADRFPRRWILLVVVAVLLLIAGIVALLLVDGDDDGTASAELAVPDLRGMTLERAEDEIEAAGLKQGSLEYAIVEESTTPSGTVLTQDPVPGALVPAGAVVDIVLARGPEPEPEEPDASEVAASEKPLEQTSTGSGQPPAAQQPPPPLPEPGEQDLDPKLVFTPIEVDKQALITQLGWTSVLHTGGYEPSFQSEIFVFEGTGEKRAVLTLFGGADCAWSVLLMNVANDTQWRWVGFAYPEPYVSGQHVYTIPLNEYAGVYRIALVGNAVDGDHVWNLDVQERR